MIYSLHYPPNPIRIKTHVLGPANEQRGMCRRKSEANLDVYVWQLTIDWQICGGWLVGWTKYFHCLIDTFKYDEEDDDASLFWGTYTLNGFWSDQCGHHQLHTKAS